MPSAQLAAAQQQASLDPTAGPSSQQQEQQQEQQQQQQQANNSAPLPPRTIDGFRQWSLAGSWAQREVVDDSYCPPRKGIIVAVKRTMLDAARPTEEAQAAVAWFDEAGQLDTANLEDVEGSRLADIMQDRWVLFPGDTPLENLPMVKQLLYPLQEDHWSWPLHKFNLICDAVFDLHAELAEEAERAQQEDIVEELTPALLEIFAEYEAVDAILPDLSIDEMARCCKVPKWQEGRAAAARIQQEQQQQPKQCAGRGKGRAKAAAGQPAAGESDAADDNGSSDQEPAADAADGAAAKAPKGSQAGPSAANKKTAAAAGSRGARASKAAGSKKPTGAAAAAAGADAHAPPGSKKARKTTHDPCSVGLDG